MTNYTDPTFEAVLDTLLHLNCLSDADAWCQAESRDEVRMDLETIHAALRAGSDVAPYVSTNWWEPEFAEDRAAAALLATETGRTYLEVAQRRLPHIHYWLRGGQLITEIVPGQVVTVRGLPDTYDVWGVFDTGQIVVGDDDLMAVYVERRSFARVLLFTGVYTSPNQDS